MSGIEILARHEVPVCSPVMGPSGELMTIAHTGEIFRYAGDVELDSELRTTSFGHSGGQPMGVAFDREGGAYVCDAAHQCLLRMSRPETEVETASSVPRFEISPYAKEYEGIPFLGPSGVAVCHQSGAIYFCDGGPLGETSLANPRGSVYCVHPSSQLLIPIALSCLAHPSGIAVSRDGKVVYVAETNKNRVLRFVENPTGVYHGTVFHQLSGRFGPIALSVSNGGDLFIGHFDFADYSEKGRIVVLDQEGEVSGILSCPGPEITGLCLTPDEKYLVITEASTNSVYKHMLR